MSAPLSLTQEIVLGADPIRYLESVGMELYEWQRYALNPEELRILLLCCRQAGKSTISSGGASHTSRFEPNSLSIILTPSEKQSQETMLKVADIMFRDQNYPALVKDSAFEKETIDGSRIVALPGTERSVRGYSGPKRIMVDEAARVLDETFAATTPMLTGNPDASLILSTTAFGKRGFFWRAWEFEKRWLKILVKPPFRLDETDHLVDDVPEPIFRKYWAQRGVLAFYSPRHFDRNWMEEELERMGPWWWRQEYGCEFIDPESSAFNFQSILEAFTDEVQPMFHSSDVVSDEVEELV